MKFLDLNGLSQLVTFGNNSYVSSVIYDSTNHVINFKNANGRIISSIDASNFIKDGMVSSVTIGTPETGPNVGKSCLIVTFNTDSGKDPIEIPIENIFSSENYYTKTEIDSQLNDKQDTLVSGTNIKTINNQSLVGSGNINITADGCEVVSNKVTSLSSSSTDTQYPSAKCVYDALDEKYSKPSGGILKTDLASAVQISLDKADTALQSYTETDPVYSASAAAGITSSDISNWNNKVSNVQSDWNATTGAAVILNKPTIPAAVTESTVSEWGFTKNAGTVTQVKVGTTAYNPSSGVVSLPAYPTSLPASDVSSWAKASSKPTYNASEVGAIATSARGAANGVAPLNASSKIDATYLPSYVNDVLEYSGLSNFPSTGETGKIYTDTSTNKIYRWSGSQYIEISPSAGVTVTNGTSALSWGTDVTVGTVNGVNITAKLPSNPDTWRGIQDNLTSSTNTTESLSAKQGYLLANGSARDNTKLPLTGGTITGTTTLTYGTNLVFVDSNGEDHSLRAFASWPDSLAHYAPGNGWVRIWDSGNDGTGSGLDADLLDGQHGSYYAAASSIPTKVSQLTNDSKFITGITSSMISTALGYTPANSASLSGYLPLSGGTLTSSANPILTLNTTNGAETGIRFQRNGTDKGWAGYNDLYGTFLYNTARYGYLCYKDDGSLLFEGNKVWHAGNDGSDSGLDADLLDGKHNGELSAISCVNLGTYGVSGSTVADCKTWLAQIFSDNALGVGYNCNVGSSYINNWNDDSAPYDPSSVHSFIKIGGGYSGTNYGQWLLSSYGTSRIGYVGRSGNQWTDIKWLANTEDIDSCAKLASPNNLMHSGNEFTFIPPNYNNNIWFNYRTSDLSLSGNVTGYYFGDGKGGALASITDGQFSGNAATATKFETTRKLWGNDFNGTSDVKGSLEIFSTGGSYNEGIRIHPASNGWSGVVFASSDNTASFGTTANTWGIHNNEGRLILSKGGTSATPCLTNVNGNWGIDTYSPAYKLDVAGDIRSTGEMYVGSTRVAKITEIPTVNNATLTVKQNGSSVGTFTANAASNVTIDLGTVLTSHQDITGKENTSNKVVSITSSSTDSQYPSSKAVYNAIEGAKSYADSAVANIDNETWTFELENGSTVTRTVLLA